MSTHSSSLIAKTDPSPDQPRPAHQFETLAQQREVGLLGMWLFLATEVMIFGGLFTGYAVYRAWYPAEFAAGSRHLNLFIGAVNTVVLLTSSLTMALAVHAAQIGERKRLILCLLLTALLGTAFMVLKGFEYYSDYVENLVPRFAFKPQAWAADGLVPDHVQLFLCFYYFMTMLHALHLTIGIVVMLIVAWMAWRGRFSPAHYAAVEVSGLYWHFIDVIWIFLLPLLYLIGTRHGLW